MPYKGLDSKQTQVGESWELSSVKGDVSVVAEGPDAGKTLTELLERDSVRLVGAASYAKFGNVFPLLIKFIDARQDLSIQVHPNDEQAMQMYGKLGKTEMWYVVKTSPGAHICAGFSQQVTQEEYKAKVEDSTIMEVLKDHEAHPGDCFYLPAGRIHSIGAGTFLAEIQETSDLTYRIFDFNRLDANGNPRELHTELAQKVIDYRCLPDYRTHYTEVPNKRVELVSCTHFTTNLFCLDKAVSADYSELDSFVIWMCLEGEAELVVDGESGHIKAGETVLLPATAKGVTINPAPTAKLLEVYNK